MAAPQALGGLDRKRSVEGLPHRALPRHIQRRLEEGVLRKRSTATKEPVPLATFGIVMSMVWCGWSVSECIEALMDAGNLASDPFLSMAPSQARREIADLYWKAVPKVARALADLDCGQITFDLCTTAARVLPSLSGTIADRLVMAALLDIAIRRASWRPTCSTRRLARDTMLSARTVSRAVHRLEDRGLLQILERNRKGTIYDLRRAERFSSRHIPLWGDYPSRGMGQDENPMLPPAHPLWSAHGVGPTAGMVWCVLATPMSAAEIAVAANLPVSSVYRALRRLEDVGLISTKGVVRQRMAVDLDAVAASCGATAKIELRLARYAEEQARWAQRAKLAC